MLDQVVEAVRVVFPSQGSGAVPSSTTSEAQSFLTQWQESQQAWTCSIELLKRENCPDEVYFIASQTLRTKVLFDFGELQPADRLQFRDAMLENAQKFCNKSNVRTQLCMCVADLVIHMDDQWPDAIANLLTKWKTDEYIPLLLGVLEYLPEENTNKRLLIDQLRRKNTTVALESQALEVLKLLHSMWNPNTPIATLNKILSCFHSWLSFLGGDKTPEDIMLPCQVLEQMLDPLVKDCFGCLDKDELGEPATDIIVEVLRICAINLNAYQSVAQKMMVSITLLKEPLAKLLQDAKPDNPNSDEEVFLKRLCRIFTETGESLVSILVDAPSNPDVQSMIQVLLACSNCPIPEISSIPLEQFWFRLARCVADHPDDAKRQEFKPIFVNVIVMLVKRAAIPADEDPFKLSKDAHGYRRQLRQVCVDITNGSRRRRPCRNDTANGIPPVALHPNEAMELVLRSLQMSAASLSPAEQEAHFFILNSLGGMTVVTQESALWSLLTDLPTLINAGPAGGRSAEEQKRVQFTKKTAMLLLGSLSKWVQQRPEFLRSTLSMISTILLSREGDAAGGNESDVLAEASESFREVAQERGNSTVVLGQVNELCQLYRATLGPIMHITFHLNIVEAVALTVQRVATNDEYQTYMSQLITPLLEEFKNAEVCNNPVMLIGILDRLTTIIRNVELQKKPERAQTLGNLISQCVWPTAQEIFTVHQANSTVVEKTCRLLKHSIRCVPDHFKPMVQAYAERIVTNFKSNQHSSYLYAAEILVNTYSDDQDCAMVLRTMFNSLSETGSMVLQQHEDFNKATELGEIVEDFFGMFDRFLKFSQDIVLTAPTLPHALSLCVRGLFTNERDAIEAVVALMERVYSIATTGGSPNNQAQATLQPLLMQATPRFIIAVFELLKSVPPSHVVNVIDSVLKVIRRWAVESANQEFPLWLNEGVSKLPPSVVNSIDNLHHQLASSSDCHLGFLVNDIAYRCEQVYLRSRHQQNK